MENYVALRYQGEMGRTLGNFYRDESQKDYAHFRNNLCLSNEFFKELTCDYLEKSPYIYEVASSKDTTVSQMVSSVKGIIEVEPFCNLQKDLPDTTLSKSEELKTGCLVAQGVYPNLTIYLSEFLEKGTFAIGVVGKKHTESFNTQVKFFKQIHHQLLFTGIALNPPIRKSNTHFGSYILAKKV